eukprot:13992375-Heterocapsa_arctica.AAC.1
MKIKNPTELKAKANICWKDPKRCMLRKAVADTYDVQNYKIEKSHTQGIEQFLEEQKEKKRWKEATNEQKMMMACFAMTQIRAERKYISGYGAVRLSRTKALEVISSKGRPQNYFIHIAGYTETITSEKFTRLGYLFFRDYGN